MVFRFRLHAFEQMGFLEDEAAELAAASDIDWHQVARMLSKGCTREQALRILL